MATQRSNLLLSIFLFVATFFYLHPATTAIGDVVATLTPAPSPTGSITNAAAFIRSSCQVTRYPDVCYSTLSRYANSINEDPAQLARVALSLSLSKARGLVSYMANHTVGGADSSATFTLPDCSSNLGDVIDHIHDSVKQIRRINSAGNRADLFKLQISNVQTWMSAGLTNVDSCTDELEGVKNGAVKENVGNQVTELKKLISNALAIVNSYATQMK